MSLFKKDKINLVKGEWYVHDNNPFYVFRQVKENDRTESFSCLKIYEHDKSIAFFSVVNGDYFSQTVKKSFFRISKYKKEYAKISKSADSYGKLRLDTSVKKVTGINSMSYSSDFHILPECFIPEEIIDKSFYLIFERCNGDFDKLINELQGLTDRVGNERIGFHHVCSCYMRALVYKGEE